MAGEDRALTTFLNVRIAALLSSSPSPRPRGPRCGATRIGLEGRVGGRRLPVFSCAGCGRKYTRLHGTSLGGRLVVKFEIFVSLLSQPLSCTEVGHLLGSLPVHVGEQVRAFRAWLLQFDPSGRWEGRVRLGERLT